MRREIAIILLATTTIVAADVAHAQSANVERATLGETNQKTPEISTEELRRVLADGSAIVLDSRKRAEFVASHIPGARNLGLDGDASASETLAASERLVAGDKTRALVLYCNGPFCQASRRLSEQLVAAGFTSVRRYQLGIPMWRALGEVTEIELDGVLRVHGRDQTAVFYDARAAEEFSRGSLAGARNISPGAVQGGRLDASAAALLPPDDFNTRIIVFGRDASQARTVAAAIARAARHNVAYFPGTFDDLKAVLD